MKCKDCKDCEYWKHLDNENGECNKLGIQVFKLFGCKLYISKIHIDLRLLSQTVRGIKILKDRYGYTLVRANPHKLVYQSKTGFKPKEMKHILLRIVDKLKQGE